MFLRILAMTVRDRAGDLGIPGKNSSFTQRRETRVLITLTSTSGIEVHCGAAGKRMPTDCHLCLLILSCLRNTIGARSARCWKERRSYRLLVFSFNSVAGPAITIFTMSVGGTGDLPYFRGRLQNDCWDFGVLLTAENVSAYRRGCTHPPMPRPRQAGG